MFGNWHHGHSLGTGALLGVALASGRVLFLLWLAFAAGVLVALLVVHAGRFVHWLERAFESRLYR